MSASDQSPRRRPRDRRTRILRAADDRFRRFGYRNVSMAQIAADVGIGASALYRHVDTKQDLLREVLAAGFDTVRDAIGEAATLDDQLAGLAGVASQSRGLWTLWEREATHLVEAHRRDLWATVRDLHGCLASALVADRGVDPDQAVLRAWAILAVFRVGTRHRGRPLVDAAAVLLCAARAVGDACLPVVAPAPAVPGSGGRLPAPVSRHEAILGAASRLFGARGYRAVTLDDIGAAAGIAGPSVYNHFPSKADLLLRVLHRVHEALWMGVHRALNTNDTAEGALHALLARHLDFALASPELVGTLRAELSHLPPRRQDALRRLEYDYVDEWTHLQQLARPDLQPGHALVLVLAALSVVNSLVRMPWLRTRPGLQEELTGLARAVLAVSPISPAPSPG